MPQFLIETILSTTPVKIDPEKVYLIGDKLFVKGNDIISWSSSNHEPMLIAAIGSMGLGFIVGWMLAFVNKFVDKTKINSTYFISIFTTIFGGAVIAFFRNSEALLGWYGMGFLVGFLIYISLYASTNESAKSPLRKIIYPHYTK